jgi:hypothetical protein
VRVKNNNKTHPEEHPVGSFFYRLKFHIPASVMISPTDLQALIEKIDGGTKGVDLVKIGQDRVNEPHIRFGGGEYLYSKVVCKINV